MAYLGANPALRRVQNNVGSYDTDSRATYGGIAGKSIYFVALTFFAAIASFVGCALLIDSGNVGLIVGLLIASAITALITGFVAVLKPNTTKVAGSIYAVAQGFTMGFTALIFFAVGYSGEVFAALFATIGTFAVMLILYSTGTIRVGSGFRKFMISALISAMLVNLVMFVVSMFSATLSDMFYGNGILSIGISVVMVIIASLMILFDLSRMTDIVQGGLDKKYEWIASFGLLVTLIWLYMEFLRLFAKLASRRR